LKKKKRNEKAKKKKKLFDCFLKKKREKNKYFFLVIFLNDYYFVELNCEKTRFFIYKQNTTTKPKNDEIKIYIKQGMQDLRKVDRSQLLVPYHANCDAKLLILFIFIERKKKFNIF